MQNAWSSVVPPPNQVLCGQCQGEEYALDPMKGSCG